MVKRSTVTLLIVIFLAVLSPVSVRGAAMPGPWALIADSIHRAQMAGAEGNPIYDWVDLDVGETKATMSNTGMITGLRFPRGTELGYLSSASLVFGCVRGTDTLLASGWGFDSYSRIRETSSHRNWTTYDPSAKGEQELSTVYSDTTIPSYVVNRFDYRHHGMIGIVVRQTSYVWADEYTRRFILMDYWIKNLSEWPIEHGCVGLRANADIYWYPFLRLGLPADYRKGYYNDDICGFLPDVPAVVPGFRDNMNMAWMADNDGDPQQGGFGRKSIPGVLGIRILRAPPGGYLSFNWWAQLWIQKTAFDWIQLINWGPRHLKDLMGQWGSLGEPAGYGGTYQMMVNGEIDYDQVYAAVNFAGKGWSPPLVNTDAVNIADGLDNQILLSYGPLDDIAPGDSVEFTVALVVGDHFHTDPSNFVNRFWGYAPKPFADNLDFSDLVTNARWADWVFDNPGVDSDTTDGNTYRGLAHVIDCDHVDTLRLDTVITGHPPETTVTAITESLGCDSVFYKGDGIPDFRGPQSPPPPEFQLTTKPGEATLRWNGAYTETFEDPISHKIDFEGYRVYVGRFDIPDQYTLLASWDKENFKRIMWDTTLIEGWRQISDPVSAELWKTILQDSSFDPRDYMIRSPDRAYRDTYIDTVRNRQGQIQEIRERDRFSYWAWEDFNRDNTYWETDRQETNLIQRVGKRDTLVEGHLMSYGIYEITLGNLQPTVPLYFAVTAFDFGDYRLKMKPLESAPITNSKYGELTYSADVVKDSGLHVAVYPNPYKLVYNDAFGHPTTYFAEGYEGAGKPEFTEFDRRIHFINLPDTATITIYSLDGDLIRTIDHPNRWLTTYSSSATWDLVSRNAQQVMSGIYIYKITSRLGSQIGKIVIIK